MQAKNSVFDKFSKDFSLSLKKCGSQEKDLQIIIGAIGAIGSFMVNYVASVYLTMHAAATSNLGSFHARLVETHQLLFGNLLAFRIEDDKTRWQTLSQLTINMLKHEEKVNGA